jgi:hypothetical protein
MKRVLLVIAPLTLTALVGFSRTATTTFHGKVTCAGRSLPG